MKINHNLTKFVLLLLITSSAAAEDFGRLPDGTAYRKTADGFEVSDYIAELEVSNQELHGRLTKVEGELAKIRLREKTKIQIEEKSIDQSAQNDCNDRLIEASELVRRQDQLIKNQNEKIKQLEIQRVANRTSAAASIKPENSFNDNLSKDAPASFKTAKTADKIESADESIDQLFKSIKALQEQRFKMYREYNEMRDRQAKPDVFEAEELVATSGRNLRALSLRAKKINSQLEEDSLIRDLSEIRSKLQKDLEELNALKRSLSKT